MQVEKLKTIDADTLLSTPMNKTLFVVGEQQESDPIVSLRRGL